jgi:dienelactone hydrolase
MDAIKSIALSWIAKNLGKDRDVLLMGNSAGAVHVMAFLFEPSLLNSVRAKVAGAVLISPPCHQRKADTGRKPANAAYYGDDASVDSNSPNGLLDRNGHVEVHMLSMVASLDEDGIIASCADFKQEYAKKGGRCDEIIMGGHNHVSPIPALNSTEVEGSK